MEQLNEKVDKEIGETKSWGEVLQEADVDPEKYQAYSVAKDYLSQVEKVYFDMCGATLSLREERAKCDAFLKDKTEEERNEMEKTLNEYLSWEGESHWATDSKGNPKKNESGNIKLKSSAKVARDKILMTAGNDFQTYLSIYLNNQGNLDTLMNHKKSAEVAMAGLQTMKIFYS